MNPTLPSVEDLDQWLDGVSMSEQSVRSSEVLSQRKDNNTRNDKSYRGKGSSNVFATGTDNPPETT